MTQTKQHRFAQQASKLNMPKSYVGDKVLLQNEKVGTFDPLWIGPYEIVEVGSNGSNVGIALTRNKRVKVHVNRLKKYHSKK